jgi:hypothetical protein
MSFAAITLCVASQLMFIVVSAYFVIYSVRKLLDTPSYVSSMEGIRYHKQLHYRPIGRRIRRRLGRPLRRLLDGYNHEAETGHILTQFHNVPLHKCRLCNKLTRHGEHVMQVGELVTSHIYIAHDRLRLL